MLMDSYESTKVFFIIVLAWKRWNKFKTSWLLIEDQDENMKTGRDNE